MLRLRSGPQLKELEILTLSYIQDAFKKEKLVPSAKSVQVIATFMVCFDSEARYNKFLGCHWSQQIFLSFVGQKSCFAQTNF